LRLRAQSIERNITWHALTALESLSSVIDHRVESTSRFSMFRVRLWSICKADRAPDHLLIEKRPLLHELAQRIADNFAR